uniref:Putative RNA-binding protein RBP10 n=1 Tax=Trypanosoma congolense (strain IL3000) TaxID=1068625 RepID=G0URN6_TRYCI|nr:putative RNA-binding protein RBP10 [Trypanosoma congolense IL3000]
MEDTAATPELLQLPILEEQQTHLQQQAQTQPAEEEPLTQQQTRFGLEASKNLQRRNVYVSGLPETYRASEFRDLCQAFGRVEASKLCIEGKCRPLKGYGFALFFEEEDANKCINGLNGLVLAGGRPLQARLADPAATPAPLDPTSAHPPISRIRTGVRNHRYPNASINSAGSALDGSVLLGQSMSFSSRDDLTDSQLGIASALLPGGSAAPTPLHTPLQPSLHPAGVTQPPGAVGYSIAPFPVPGGYMPIGPSFIPQQAVGMPLFVTMPPSTPVSGTAPQQLVVPTTVVAANGYTPQLCSSVLYSSLRVD